MKVCLRGKQKIGQETTKFMARFQNISKLFCSKQEARKISPKSFYPGECFSFQERYLSQSHPGYNG